MILTTLYRDRAGQPGISGAAPPSLPPFSLSSLVICESQRRNGRRDIAWERTPVSSGREGGLARSGS